MKIKKLVSLGILPKKANTITLVPFVEGCIYLSTYQMDEIDKTANILFGFSQGFSSS
jgi:hypothetical protein